MLDAVRLGPDDDEIAVTAAQARDAIVWLIAAGHWRDGDPAILVIFDAGYDIPRLSFLLADLPVQVLGRAALRPRYADACIAGPAWRQGPSPQAWRSAGPR